jgi:hypothetical protein
MFPVRYELGVYIPEDVIFQSPPWKPQILEAGRETAGHLALETEAYHAAITTERTNISIQKHSIKNSKTKWNVCMTAPHTIIYLFYGESRRNID